VPTTPPYTASKYPSSRKPKKKPLTLRTFVSTFFPVRQGRVSGGVAPGHRALDIAAPAGTPVFAARSGIVQIGGGDPGYGNLIRVQDRATGVESLYAHLSAFAENIRSGSQVRGGQLIGYVGSTGQSSGPHLHFEVNPIGMETFAAGSRSDVAARDPLSFLGAAVQPSGLAGILAPPRVVTTVQVKAPKSSKTPTAAEARAGGSAFGQASKTVALGAARQGLEGAATGGLAQLLGLPATTIGDAARAAASGGMAQIGKQKTTDRLFGLLGGPTFGEVSSAGQRVAFALAGYSLMMVGVLVLVYSYRSEIVPVVTKTGKAAAGAAVGAAAGPAGAAAGAAAA